MAPSPSAGKDNNSAAPAFGPAPTHTRRARDSGEGGDFAAPSRPVTGDGTGDGTGAGTGAGAGAGDGHESRDDGGAKKRKTGAKRGIADLTPAQLARKRANG